jgi:outer membrane protein TolC
MRTITMVLAFVVVLGFSLAQAQDPAPAPSPAPPVENATPAADPAPAPEENPAPGADAEQTAPPAEEKILEDKSMQETISLNLIDLDALRQAIESRASSQMMRLSLQDCLAIALKQNRDVVIAELEPQRSDGDVMTAKGEFDPLWKSTYAYMRSSMSTNQQFSYFGQGISQVDLYQTTANSSVLGKLKTGTQYSLGLDWEKEESTYGRFIADHSTRLTLSLSQPLLRGFSWKANTVHIQASKNLRNISESQFRLQVMNTLSDVIKAYWDLVGTNEALKVREQSLANAERLLQVNEARRKIGTVADLEVLQAKPVWPRAKATWSRHVRKWPRRA